MISPVLNTIINTIYFALTFGLEYALLRYVESYVGYNVHRLKNIHANKILYLFLLFILCINTLTGFLFSFNAEGEYIHGSFYLLVYVLPIYYVAYSTAVLVKTITLLMYDRNFPSAYI